MKKWPVVIQKACTLKTSNFWPHLPLVCPCLFYMYLPPQRTFALVSPPSLCHIKKNFRGPYDFLNEKSVSENREKNNFFCRLKHKDQ